MQENQIDRKQLSNGTKKIIKPRPVIFFIVSVVIIFVAEALVMLMLSILDLHESYFVGIIDASLLSFFVVTTLYYTLFKPMRETIHRLDSAEQIQSQLEEVDQLKSDFISVAAHELCVPIATIKGYTEILLEDVELEKRKDCLEIIYDKIHSLERIIDDLGIVDRLETGGSLQISPVKQDLLSTVNHVFNVYQIRFPDIPIRLELPERPLILSYDETRISQVLDNLLSNAVKFSSNVHGMIELSVVDQGKQVLIRVRDEGIGMDKDELRQIYNKFYRAKTEISDVGGLGLGMSIVKNIVETHNGTIEIASLKNVGTTVTVTLPKSTEFNNKN